MRAVTMRTTVQRRRRSRAQSLAEFALVAPVVLVLIMGAAQLGMIFYAGVTVASAAHDGAKVASEKPIGSTAYQYSGGAVSVGGGATCPSAGNPVCTAVTGSQGLLSGVKTVINPGSALGTGTNCPAGSVPDGYVTVKVSDDVPIFVPFLNTLFANSPSSTVRTMSNTVTMRVEPCTLTNGS